jgi:asparagine synthetase B (glutamine-hydrolysing)
MSWLRSDQEVALNDVVRALRAAAQRHEAAAERAEHGDLRGLLRDTAAHRERLADELVRQSQAEAAIPDLDQEFFRDVLSKAREALASDTDSAIAAEAVADEDAIATAVEAALNLELPEPVRALLGAIRGQVAKTRETFAS